MICRVCGVDNEAVRPAIAQWAEPVDGRTWEAVLRCPDREACAGRVRAAGRVWPLVEAQAKPPEVPGRKPRAVDTEAEMAAFRRHAAELASRGLVDPRPPREDPKTGEVTFREPLPMPPIATDDPEKWW